ncbi:dephospho-CoA kinase [Psychromicrobium lacuslunae]|uniref:Dephospho-CoA kinase n=1 Tax=Psychromicrobium lacuslunae TaxID=1618207 RepID=A0A0D4BXJ1_9MICC|nr:dephospho-CoA kinase [Psychromicrobium lacuslunae]AJT40841.1 dephospho-CoA kinase [Psychromicrobium lacuslunae]
MLSIGLTGGIAAGKSLVGKRLAELGAVLIDADLLAREVVAPGTAGLAEIRQTFGAELISGEGELNRARLGELIFSDQSKREKLNAIVHPKVRARAAELRAEAGREAIIVQDIPLLVETGQGANFHLVIVVDAADELRVARMVTLRGLSEAEAQDRLRAQASRQERLSVADIVLDNNGTEAELLSQIDEVWENRLQPFNHNLLLRQRAKRCGPAVLSPADPRWPEIADRLASRIMLACGDQAVGVDHIGSTSIPGLDAKDVIDLQLRVRSLEIADQLAPALAAAGFPALEGDWRDTPKSFDPDPEHWLKRLHGNADPGQQVNLHVRVDGSAGANYALAFRDWLRADTEMKERYLQEKRRLAELHANDANTGGYAEAKEPWFTEVAEPGLAAWLARAN